MLSDSLPTEGRAVDDLESFVTLRRLLQRSWQKSPGARRPLDYKNLLAEQQLKGLRLISVMEEICRDHSEIMEVMEVLVQNMKSYERHIFKGSHGLWEKELGIRNILVPRSKLILNGC